MLIGKHGEETTIYRAAHAFEQGGDWRSLWVRIPPGVAANRFDGLGPEGHLGYSSGAGE